MAVALTIEILKSLRASPLILRTLVRDLDDSTVRYRPGPNEWAIVEVVAHMADTDERALARVQRILSEDDPALPSFDQEELARERNYIGMSLGIEVDRYERGRQRHVATLMAMGPSGWQRVGEHGEHKRISIELYEAHVASEDIDHLAQIASLIAELRRLAEIAQ